MSTIKVIFLPPGIEPAKSRADGEAHLAGVNVGYTLMKNVVSRLFPNANWVTPIELAIKLPDANADEIYFLENVKITDRLSLEELFKKRFTEINRKVDWMAVEVKVGGEVSWKSIHADAAGDL